jgi:hypothetical protein
MHPDDTPQAITFRFDPALRLRTAIFSGVVTDDKLTGAYRALVAEPDYDAGADDLVDLRGVTHLGVTPVGMRSLMELFAPVDDLAIPTRLAIVAPNDAVYGVSRVYEMLRGKGVPEEIAVFRDLLDAMHWLAEGREHRGAARTSAA